MPTRPKNSPELTLADARKLLLALKKYGPLFLKADHGRKAKLLRDGFAKVLDTNVKEASRAIGAKSVQSLGVKGATANEVKARGALLTVLQLIRDDVALGHPEEPAIGRAFGVGRPLIKDSTPKLIAAADALIEAYAEPANKKAGSAAGVTPARIAQCQKLRDALAAADAAQNAGFGSRKGVGATAESVLAAVRRDAAHLRKVAKHVLRGNKAALAEFESTVPRHTPKKRAKKPAAPAAATGGA